MIFVVLSGLVGVVYSQMNTTFGVYLTRTYGYRRVRIPRCCRPTRRWSFCPVSAGALGRSAGSQPDAGAGRGIVRDRVCLIGFAPTLFWFWGGVVILTIGEMVIVPAAQTVTADLAPIDMRGRYQAVFGLTNNFFYGLARSLAVICSIPATAS